MKNKKRYIFTPTCNRSYMVQNHFEPLKSQSCFYFEWLVIDDGSTDNTEELFREWVVVEMPFQIRFYKFENDGKCRAINKALTKAGHSLLINNPKGRGLWLTEKVTFEKKAPKKYKIAYSFT